MTLAVKPGDLPASNRAAVMTAPETIELLPWPVRAPGPREAMVEIRSVGVCGSDTAYFTLGRIGDYVVDGPLVLGHEAAGRVIAVGSEVTRVQPGDRVAIEPGTPCRDCPQCRRGDYHLCPRLEFLATPPYHGALMQYLTIDERNLFPLPDELGYDDGALVEPLSVGIWACRRAGVVAGDAVLITGAGPVGVVTAEAARAFGAGRVCVVDPDRRRLDVIAERGHDHATELTETESGFDVVIECSGATDVLGTAMRRLAPGGRVAIVGLPKKPVSLPVSELNPGEPTIHFVNRYKDTWPTGIALIASGRVRTDGIVSRRYRLDQTAEALLAARRIPGLIKAIIDPQEVA